MFLSCSLTVKLTDATCTGHVYNTVTNLNKIMVIDIVSIPEDLNFIINAVKMLNFAKNNNV